MDKTSSLENLLRKRSLKVTPIRLAVLRCLAENESALPFRKMQVALKDFDRVTLYRNLKTLTDQGLIHKAMMDEIDTYYALCNHSACDHEQHQHDHVHFKCESCKKVTCVDLEEELAIQLKGFAISNVEISVSGVCGGCLG